MPHSRHTKSPQITTIPTSALITFWHFSVVCDSLGSIISFHSFFSALTDSGNLQFPPSCLPSPVLSFWFTCWGTRAAPSTVTPSLHRAGQTHTAWSYVPFFPHTPCPRGPGCWGLTRHRLSDLVSLAWWEEAKECSFFGSTWCLVIFSFVTKDCGHWCSLCQSVISWLLFVLFRFVVGEVC